MMAMGAARGDRVARSQPLSGLRVLDVSSAIAGGYATKLLADAGADVLKVEEPGGDPLRRWTASGAPLPAGEDGALFRFLHGGKRSRVLDLGRAPDRDALLSLCADADLVFESGVPGALAARGVGFAALRSRNPAVSLVSISPWGTAGPWARRPATEFTLQAATGSIGYRGLRDRAPVAAGGRIGEWIAGSFAAAGGLAAWLAARSGGAGQHVDLSSFECMILCLTVYHDLAGQWFEGPLPRAIEIPSIEPAKDGYVGFCTITGQQWKDFCLMVGHPEVGEDPRFYDGRARMEHLHEMQAMIHGWTRQRSVDEIIEQATGFRIPVAPVGNGATLPRMDHFAARGVFLKNPHGFLQPRVPYRLERTPPPAPRRAPSLDEHRGASFGASPPARREAGPVREAPLPLAGLRVVDLSAFWAGPFATAWLVDLGADVVKIESIQRPDGMRFAGALRVDPLWERSPVFHGANRGKRDVTLRLDSEEGRALLRRLVEGADVVVENFSVRVLENLGLGWETLRAWNPRLVMVRMPAFGLDGPWRDRTGFAMTVEQVSGLAWITGYPDLPLVVRGACDPVGGMHAVFALLLALEERRATGRGQLVEVPLVEVALNVAAEQVLEHSAYGRLLSRDGNRGPCAAPQGVYACAGPDEHVALAVASDAQWRALRALLGDPAWARDPALDTAAGRRARHDEIDAQLGAWCAARSRGAAEGALLAAGIPASAVINAHFLMPNPQLEQRGFFRTLEHPVTGRTRYPGLPMRFSAWPEPPRDAPAPTLGQHNREILCGELGLSEAELAALREKGIVGEKPSFLQS
jgi:crotonobetainyl-CoA:carnitine CoA-transferase CaiB-like acyl-CoA transferase